VYKYTTAGVYQSSFDISTQSGNGYGITTDGTYLWVIDFTDDEVYKYTTAGVYQSSFDISTQSSFGRGITTDGTYLWVIDSSDDEVYKYEGPSPIPYNVAVDSDASFSRNIDGWCNATVKIETGVANLKTVDLKINQTLGTNFTLRWTQSTDTFSETSDGDNICTLNTTRSTRVNLNVTTDQICFCFAITGGADGPCNATLTSTNDDDTSDIDDYIDEFTYQTYGWDPLGDIINSAFNYFGIPNYMGDAIAYVNGMTAQFSTSIENMLTLITQQFRIITNTFTWVMRWVTRFTDMILTLTGFVTGIFSDTIPGITNEIGNIWTFIDLANWYPFVTLVGILTWIDSIAKRGRTQGEIQVLIRDLQTITSILSYFSSMFTLVINTVVDTTFRLFDAIT